MSRLDDPHRFPWELLVTAIVGLTLFFVVMVWFN